MSSAGLSVLYFWVLKLVSFLVYISLRCPFKQILFFRRSHALICAKLAVLFEKHSLQRRERKEALCCGLCMYLTRLQCLCRCFVPPTPSPHPPHLRSKQKTYLSLLSVLLSPELLYSTCSYVLFKIEGVTVKAC
jgi:hypothetical protein